MNKTKDNETEVIIYFAKKGDWKSLSKSILSFRDYREAIKLRDLIQDRRTNHINILIGILIGIISNMFIFSFIQIFSISYLIILSFSIISIIILFIYEFEKIKKLNSSEELLTKFIEANFKKEGVQGFKKQ